METRKVLSTMLLVQIRETEISIWRFFYLLLHWISTQFHRLRFGRDQKWKTFKDCQWSLGSPFLHCLEAQFWLRWLNYIRGEIAYYFFNYNSKFIQPFIENHKRSQLICRYTMKSIKFLSLVFRLKKSCSNCLWKDFLSVRVLLFLSDAQFKIYYSYF